MAEYMFRDEVADFLGVHKTRVSRMVKQGQLTIVDIVLDDIRYRPRFLRAEVEALKAKRDSTPDLKKGGRPKKNP